MVYYLFRLDPESKVVDKLLSYLEENMEIVNYVPSKRRIVCASTMNADKSLTTFFEEHADSNVIFESHCDEIRIEYQYNILTGCIDMHALLPLMPPNAIMNL